MIRMTLAATAALLSPAATPAGPAIGTATLIVSEVESRSTGGDSTSSSSDRDAVVERVIGVSDAGLELEYDYPADVPAKQRAGDWRFPLRVLQPAHGPRRLLNRAALATRLDAWLKAAGIPRSACGHWIMTWNAFRIDCDPDAALGAVEPVDLGLAGLGEGTRHAGPNGTTVSFSHPVDADQVRRELADSDVAVGDMSGEAVTPAAAVKAHAADRITGTVQITYDLNADGSPRRRVSRTTVTVGTGKTAETTTKTETVERRPLPAGTAQARRSTI